MVICSGVNRYARGQSGVMIWIQKSLSNEVECCKFSKDGITETRLKMHGGH
jgi:hypothetical protein